MNASASHSSTAAVPLHAQASRWPLAGAAALLLVYGWVFSHFLTRQAVWAWEHQADWGHTIVIPLIALWFVHLRRDRLLAAPFRTTWWALIVVAAGIALYSISALVEAARHHNLQGLGAWLSLCGLVLLFVGRRAMRWLWFPLLYLLVFGQSLSDHAMSRVTLPMQDFAARGAHFLLILMGLDADRSGNTLWLNANGTLHPLNIAEACSGMRMLMAFLALGVAMAYTGLSRMWQRALLVLLAVPTALLVNVLRVVTLGLLSLVDSGLAAGDFHTFIGLIWLVPALFMYMGLVWVIKRLVVETRNSHRFPNPTVMRPAAPSKSVAVPGFRLFDRAAPAALAVALATLVLCGAGFRVAVQQLNVHLSKLPVELRHHLSSIPRRLGPWHATGDDLALDEASVESLGTSMYLSRVYELESDGGRTRLSLHIAYYTGMVDAVPHIPDRCMVAAGWNQLEAADNVVLDLRWPAATIDPGPPNRASGEPYQLITTPDPLTGAPETIRLPLGQLALRTSAFGRDDAPSVRQYAGFFFIANHHAMANPLAVRSLAFSATQRHAYYAKVELQMTCGAREGPQRFLAPASDLVQRVLPHLMRCLPDWSEVESSSP
jgi:exosortase